MLCPIAVLPVVAADVDHAVRNSIVRDLLAMAVAIDQHCGREFSGWRFGPFFRRGRQRRFGGQFCDGWLRIIGMRGGSTLLCFFGPTESHITIALPLDQQGSQPGFSRRIVS